MCLKCFQIFARALDVDSVHKSRLTQQRPDAERVFRHAAQSESLTNCLRYLKL